MEGFIIGFFAALGWVPVIFVCWLLRAAFSTPLDLGSG